jgi:hypothetical protein
MALLLAGLLLRRAACKIQNYSKARCRMHAATESAACVTSFGQQAVVWQLQLWCVAHPPRQPEPQELVSSTVVYDDA